MLPRSVQVLLDIAQSEADARPNFREVKGPGAGDRFAAGFVAAVREKTREALGADFAEKGVVEGTAVRVDYWFPEEATVVEIALSLANPLSEFERDVLKAVIARADGLRVNSLVLVAKDGAATRQPRPWLKRVVKWARTQGVEVSLHLLRVNPAV